MLSSCQRLLWCLLIAGFLGALPQFAGAVEWRSRIDLSVAQNQALVDEWGPQGFAPIYSKCTVVNGRRTFDVVFMKLPNAWEYRDGMEDADFEKLNRNLVDKGFSLVSHQTYKFDGKTLHDVIWHK